LHQSAFCEGVECVGLAADTTPSMLYWNSYGHHYNSLFGFI